MPDTIPESDILDALRVMRESLEADGYGLNIRVDGPRLRLELTVISDACADCLIPASIMTAIVSSTLAERGIEVNAGAIEIIYPPESAGTVSSYQDHGQGGDSCATQ